MSYRSDVIYRFDETELGFYTCVFESYVRREIPVSLLGYDSMVMPIYNECYIESDHNKAERVKCSLMKISCEITSMIEYGFNTCLEDKYTVMYRFVRLAFVHGRKVEKMLTDDTVNALSRAVRALTRETHLLKGFIRFSDYHGVLVSVIEPKNMVLPLLSDHFGKRYPREYFLIFDKNHKMALIHEPHRSKLIELEKLVLPDSDAGEQYYRDLWRCFYNTVGIEERYNPRCRMNNMPKRFWNNMTEFQKSSDLLSVTEDTLSREKELEAGTDIRISRERHLNKVQSEDTSLD